MRQEAKREAIRAINPRPAWQEKVDAMNEAEITAIYRTLKDQGKVK
jgi:hypothetical protein